jgi:hypothetical protein
VLGAAWEGEATPAINPVLTTNPAPVGFVEVSGVEAGRFDANLWERSAPELAPDIRSPLLEPLEGAYRNIYAPSAVETATGYRLFYGAWDGIPTGNDRIYSLTTDPHFQTFAERHSILLPGSYLHVCNVNALRLDDGTFAMFATVYPVTNRNKPAFFRSDLTGTNWNGLAGEPYTVRAADIISIAGYPYANADVNGMNVLLRENGVYRLWFGDFQNFDGVYRATSQDGRRYVLEGRVLAGAFAVNDVKSFRVGAVTHYLLGLHLNGDRLWHSLSTNGLEFPPPVTLLQHRDSADRYIVAMGWVVRGPEGSADRKLLGLLYGAGAAASLDRNRLYARWLQKRAVFVTEDGVRYGGMYSLGPDRQLLRLPAERPVRGRWELYGEDSRTLLGVSGPQTVTRGQSWRLR